MLRWILSCTFVCGAALTLPLLPGCPTGPGGAPAPGDNANGDSANDNVGTPPENLPPITHARLTAVNDYAYQLQGDPELDLGNAGDSAFDLLVIDYSRDGSDAGHFLRDEIAALKASPGGPKIVLAYLSIGEAEIGRFYFDNAWITPDPEAHPDGPFQLTDAAPAFLAPPNPQWPDNFKVRYWLAEWQQIIVTNPGGHPVLGDAPSYLDRIIDAGFDGVYLDIVDAYEYFGPQENGGDDENRFAAADMIDFIAAIAEHARNTRGLSDFIVVPQNGAEIIRPASYVSDALRLAGDVDAEADAQQARFFGVIDALGAEDTFYYGDADENNPFAPDANHVATIDRYRAAGKLVLAIDYLTRRDLIDEFYAQARARGWVPYCSVRLLDRLTINPSQPPD